MSLMIPPTRRAAKGRKVVAQKNIVEERINWAESYGRFVCREQRGVYFELHPTKGWRRVWATEWRTVT